MFNCLQQLPKYWRNRNALTYLLWPIELVYKFVIRLRQGAYALGIFKQHRLDATVLVVGNVVAGGGGKTPLTIAIVQRLKAEGYKIGVLSRGYGRSNSSLQIVNAQSLANEVGDEPLMIFQKCDVPVVVGAQRVEQQNICCNNFLRSVCWFVTMACNTSLFNVTLKYASWTTWGWAMATCCLPARCESRGQGPLTCCCIPTKER